MLAPRLTPLADRLGPGPEFGGLPAAAEPVEETGAVPKARHQATRYGQLAREGWQEMPFSDRGWNRKPFVRRT
jgi:hypothetical protein